MQSEYAVRNTPDQTSGTLTQSLRQDADSHLAKQIDVQSIYFRQGREIARTYIDVMTSYARLDAQSGRFEQEDGKRIVSGFCRIDEGHFDQPLLKRERKQSFWTAQWAETVEMEKHRSDLFSAFCTSFAEFCQAEQIELGKLCALVRRKDGTLEYKPFPVQTVLPERVEAIGYPYKIRF